MLINLLHLGQILWGNDSLFALSLCPSPLVKAQFWPLQVMCRFLSSVMQTAGWVWEFNIDTIPITVQFCTEGENRNLKAILLRKPLYRWKIQSCCKWRKGRGHFWTRNYCFNCVVPPRWRLSILHSEVSGCWGFIALPEECIMPVGISENAW